MLCGDFFLCSSSKSWNRKGSKAVSPWSKMYVCEVFLYFFKPAFPCPDKSKARPHANIWIYLPGGKLMVHLCHWHTFSAAIDLFARDPKKLPNGSSSVALGHGACSSEQLRVHFAACHQCVLSWKKGNLSCLICNEWAIKKSARKSFVPSSSSALSMRPCLNSVCSVLRGQFMYPCRACFASKHCKVQVGLRKKVCKVIGFDERRRKKHHLLFPADEDVSGFSCCFLHTHGHWILLSSV